MTQDTKSKEERLAKLESQLADLKKLLPEHCSGTDGYVAAHAASPAHWQKIEEIEEQIAQIKKELGR